MSLQACALLSPQICVHMPKLTHTTTKLPSASDRCNWAWITSQDGAADPRGGVAGLAATAVQVLSAARPGQGVSNAADAARAGGRVLRVIGRIADDQHSGKLPLGRQTRHTEGKASKCRQTMSTWWLHEQSARNRFPASHVSFWNQGMHKALTAVSLLPRVHHARYHSPTPMLSSLPYRHCEMLEQGP
jgi:hypothetical protein